MIEPYHVFLRAEAIDALRGIRGRQRQRIAAFINALAFPPSTAGDYAIQDSSRRSICISIIGSYAVTFWADHPVKEIKITDIRRADRARAAGPRG